MECKHKYFTMVDGVRVCSVCGKPASEVKQEIEDKMQGQGENKASGVVYPPESPRITKVVKHTKTKAKKGK